MGLEENQFIDGTRESNGYRFLPTVERSVKSRNQVLCDIIREKRVLHVGFADHQDLIQLKLEQGRWLHKVVISSAREAFGFDVNEGAVRFIRSLGFTNITSNRDEIPDVEFDVLLFPDVIEHLPNVVDELISLRETYRFCEIVVTTPNAFRLQNRSYFRTEAINSDHRYWFSPYTLAKVLADAGYSDISIGFTEGSALRRPLVRAANLLADGLIAGAAPRSSVYTDGRQKI